MEWKKGTIEAAHGKNIREFWHLPLPGLEFGKGPTVLVVEGLDGWNLFFSGTFISRSATAEAGKKDAEQRLAALIKGILAFVEGATTFTTGKTP